MPIDFTQLTPTMQRNAAALKQRFPEVQFTSGRRSEMAQARAMAVRVLQKRTFCQEVYPHTLEFQRAIDAINGPLTLESASQALTNALLSLSAEKRSRLAHLYGRAVDLSSGNLEDPDGIPTALGYAVKDWIQHRPDTDYFTTREANMVQWHWAVKAEPEITSVQV